MLKVPPIEDSIPAIITVVPIYSNSKCFIVYFLVNTYAKNNSKEKMYIYNSGLKNKSFKVSILFLPLYQTKYQNWSVATPLKLSFNQAIVFPPVNKARVTELSTRYYSCRRA